MTPAAFRKLALSLPGAEEGAHGGHPDFRIAGKIFATLGYPDASLAVVALTSEEQGLYCEAEPETFVPVPGGWGRRGSTHVRLKAARKPSVEPALIAAWRRKAPKSLQDALAAKPKRSG